MTSLSKSRFQDPDGKNRAITVLLKNFLVSHDANIAENIFKNSTLKFFNDGDILIKQLDRDDHVLFILSGKVEISVAGKTRRIVREAPEQVGEMSAINATDARSATVKASGGPVEALEISSSAFNALRSQFADFNIRCLEQQNDRNKQWKEQKTEMTWYDRCLNLRSIIIAIAAILLIPLFIELRKFLSTNTSLIVVLTFLALILIFGVNTSRTVKLWIAFTTTCTATIWYFLAPIEFKLHFELPALTGTLRSVENKDGGVIFAVLALNLLLLLAAIWSQKNEN